MLERLEVWNPWWEQERVDESLKGSIKRALLEEIKPNRPIVITGPRRAGKSTLLHQIVEREGKKRGWGEILFVNLVDGALRNKDPQEVVESYVKRFRPSRPLILVDEVQLNREWFSFIRGMVDRKEAMDFILTGSTSYLLRGKVGSLLAGRAEVKTLFPLSFKEMYEGGRGWLGKKRGEGIVEHYLRYGAYPEVFLAKGEEKVRILSTYAQSIASEDIAANHNLSYSLAWDFLHFLAVSLPSKLSVNAVRKKFGISFERAEELVEAFIDSFILLKAPLYSTKPALSYRAPWKGYLVDNGLRKALEIREELGKELEMLVFQELLKEGWGVAYHQGKRECDFILLKGGRPVYALQVTLEEERKREVEGLEEAMEKYRVDGEIVTRENLLSFLKRLPRLKEEL